MAEIETKEKREPNMFDIIYSVMSKNKKNILEHWPSELFDKHYNPYNINKYMSYMGNDIILNINEMNKYWELDKDIQYMYYYHKIPSMYRNTLKKQPISDISHIREKYKCNNDVAMLYSHLINEVSNKK